jgi:riboflavin kinase/FMN adenylyltransferase
MNDLGIENLVVKKFTKEFSRLSALEFVRDILVNELHTKHIIVGYDHRFGRNREANIKDLKNFGETFGFEIEEISAQDINDVTISSTKIRKALQEGDVSIANAYLGYNFRLTGNVIKGKGLGKKIGYPTANIQVKETYKLIPKQGVYVVKTNYNGNVLFGMMNIGTNPTVNGKKQSIEISFFNFNNNLYEQELKIELLQRIRDEQKFDSIEDLKNQLNKDKQTAQKFINTHFE